MVQSRYSTVLCARELSGNIGNTAAVWLNNGRCFDTAVWCGQTNHERVLVVGAHANSSGQDNRAIALVAKCLCDTGYLDSTEEVHSLPLPLPLPLLSGLEWEEHGI